MNLNMNVGPSFNGSLYGVIAEAKHANPDVRLIEGKTTFYRDVMIVNQVQDITGQENCTNLRLPMGEKVQKLYNHFKAISKSKFNIPQGDVLISSQGINGTNGRIITIKNADQVETKTGDITNIVFTKDPV